MYLRAFGHAPRRKHALDAAAERLGRISAAPSAGKGGKMHEYSLTRQIVKIVNRAATEHGAKKVVQVRLVLGESSGIIAESVQLYFDQIARGTPAEGAKLAVRQVQPQMHCSVCNRNFVRPRFSFACPDCGTLGNPTDIGSECYVEGVELETDTPD